MAADSIIGNLSSPYTPGSAYLLLHFVMGELTDDGSWCYVRGGMGGLSEYLAKLAEKKGAVLTTSAPV